MVNNKKDTLFGISSNSTALVFMHVQLLILIIMMKYFLFTIYNETNTNTSKISTLFKIPKTLLIQIEKIDCFEQR